MTISTLAMNQSKEELTEFEKWYTDEDVRRLIRSSQKEIPCLRYVFYYKGDGENPYKAFINQFKQLITLKNKLQVPVYFIAMRPGDKQSSHYIAGIIVDNNVDKHLIVMNPLGDESKDDFYKVIFKVRDLRLVNHIWISNTKIQNDVDGLVSCGPVCVELINHFSSLSIKDILQMLRVQEPKIKELGFSKEELEEYVLADAKVKLPYNPIDISSHLSEILNLLLKTEQYQIQLQAVRRHHEELLKQSQVKEWAFEQTLVFNMTEREVATGDIEKEEAYLELCKELEDLKQKKAESSELESKSIDSMLTLTMEEYGMFLSHNSASTSSSSNEQSSATTSSNSNSLSTKSVISLSLTSSSSSSIQSKVSGALSARLASTSSFSDGLNRRPRLTKGGGDCAIHAALGEWDGTQFICRDVASARKKIVDTIRKYRTNVEVYKAVRAAIQHIIMSSEKGGPQIKSSREAYQQHVCNNQAKINEAWDRFENEIKKYPEALKYINEKISEYIKEKQADKNNPLSADRFTSFKSQFNTCLNLNDGELYGIILSFEELQKSFEVYNNQSIENFDLDRYLTLEVIEEYAGLVGTLGYWMLPCELKILAYASDITIEHSTKEWNTKKNRLIGTYNPGRPNPVPICFNGTDYFEREATDEECKPTAKAVKSKMKDIKKETNSDNSLSKRESNAVTLSSASAVSINNEVSLSLTSNSASAKQMFRAKEK